MTDRSTPDLPDQVDYATVHTDIVALLESARRAAARSVNALMTASYWEIGRRIIEFEQGGKDRAEYGQALLKRLSNKVLTAEYRTALPDEKLLAEELEKTRRELEARRIARSGDVEGCA